MDWAFEFPDLNNKWYTLFVGIMFNFMQDFLVSISGKGCSGSGDDMQKDAQCPDVASLVIVFVEDFWWDVVGSTNYFVCAWHFHLGLHVVVPLEGKSEIDEHYIIILRVREKEILSFEVPMTYFLQVKVVHRLYHLYKDLPCELFMEAATLIDAIKQLASFTQTVLRNKYSSTR